MANRWQSRFGRWTRRYGAARLGRDLGLSGPAPVYHWLAGRHEPRPEHARRILELAHGRLAYADLYGAPGHEPGRS